MRKNRTRRLPLFFSLFLLIAALAAVVTFSQSSLQVGFALMSPAPGSAGLAGSALFTYQNASGVLISQAAVGAIAPITNGRVFVQEASTDTGIAFANPSSSPANMNLRLSDASGQTIDQRTQVLGAGQQMARFVRELFSVQNGFVGSVTFSSDQPVSAITLRQGRTIQGEPLYTTLPVVNIDATPATSTFFPHLAAGEGYITQLILINPTTTLLQGQVRLYAPDGLPLTLSLSGVDASSFSYSLQPGGVWTGQLESNSGLQTGYAVTTAAAGQRSPSGTIIFEYRKAGNLISAAGVTGVPTTRARIYVDYANTQTGLAIANTSPTAQDVTFTLLNRSGTAISVATRTLPGQGQLARFVHEIFPEVKNGFAGLLEIGAVSPIVPITLKLTFNARSDLILTTLPVADLAVTSTPSTLVFPHLAFGEGFSTRLIVLNASATSAASGQLSFRTSAGTPLNVPLEERVDTQFSYAVLAGSGRQYLPGNVERVVSLAAVDFSTNDELPETTLNEGSASGLLLRARDSAGQFRDDYDTAFASLNTSVVTVDATGTIRGVHAGFATVTVTARGIIVPLTMTVVKVDSGSPGFEVSGAAQDSSHRFYFSAVNDHMIVQADDLTQTPSLYAGMPHQLGLRNDLRLQSQFNNPTFLALDRGSGNLYVSDSSNNVIRIIRPGTNGVVETFAQAFNNPQGIALDVRGYLWVADSANHVIRRINLQTRAVEDVAGSRGTPGFSDGVRDTARFQSPVGLAVEIESTAQQLDRERLGQPPPPTRVLVADSGNGALRRVYENGTVETIDGANSSVLRIQQPVGKLTRIFSTPTAVAVDLFGTIYVGERDSGQVKAILPTGAVVKAAGSGTFSKIATLAATDGGSLLTTDQSTARVISYGGPQITGVEPARVRSTGGDVITIRGINFAPETAVVFAGIRVSSFQILDTQTITFKAPPGPSGSSTITLQNRGGIAQRQILLDPPSLNSLVAGIITTIAGGGTFAGDGGPASAAFISYPDGIAIDGTGNLYIADSQNNRIRRVAYGTGIITTIAGTGQRGFSGDGDLATAASLSSPLAVAIDSAGNIFVADTGNARIRRVDSATGFITTVAGTGIGSQTASSGPALGTGLGRVRGLTFNRAGALYITEEPQGVRRIDFAAGTITALTSGRSGFAGDGGPASQAAFAVNGPIGIAADSRGNVYVADRDNHRIRKIDAATNVVSTFAGNGVDGQSGDNGPAASASLSQPWGVAVDPSDNVYITSRGLGRIRKVTASNAIITTIAGIDPNGFSGDGGPASRAAFSAPQGLALDGAANLFIADSYNFRIRRIEARNNTLNTFAGTGNAAVVAGAAIAATFQQPTGIFLDAAENMFIADNLSHVIRRIDSKLGTIATIAGDGFSGFPSGDGGPATATSLQFPYSVLVDGSGNVVFSAYHGIRRIDPRTGIISTLAGGGLSGFSGDGTAASTGTRFNFPLGLAIDAQGGIYIADWGNNRIRKIDGRTSVVSTIAGTGQRSYSGDGGPAASATLAGPRSVAVDANNNVFIADSDNNRIRRIDANGRISTVAGDGRTGFAGDNGPAVNASVGTPLAVSVDAQGNLYITTSARIRKVNSAGIITTLAGTGRNGYSGDDGPALDAQLSPGLALVDSSGNLVIVDTFNNRIRAVRGPLP